MKLLIRTSVVTTHSALSLWVPNLQNEFIGAATNYWECGSNWVTKDDLPAQHSPCGDDRAFFDKVHNSIRSLQLVLQCSFNHCAGVVFIC